MTYTINVESLSYGATNDVTVTDAILPALHVDSMAVALSADLTVPGWTDPCVLSREDVDGYGGTVTCVLNGTLERGRTTPNITIIATVSPSTPPGTLLNVAEVRWTDPEDVVAGVYSEDDSAPVGVILTDRELAATGAMGLPYELAATLIALSPRIRHGGHRPATARPLAVGVSPDPTPSLCGRVDLCAASPTLI